ncbi:MAG TPA: SGNH/GDSL hydrolase family protein [Actinomycetota bacterium]|nr:SGNH/GDSL hydrolase family protein [Actinomycetota bacterium]
MMVFRALVLVLVTAALTFPAEAAVGTYHYGLFVGDSITGGYYADRYSDIYAVRVADGLSIASVKLNNSASHCRSSKIGSSTNTDFTVVEIGTDCGWMTADQFTSFYDDLLLKLPPGTRIVCLGIWKARSSRSVYDPIIESSCAAHSGAFASLGAIYDDPNMHVQVGQATPWGVSADTFHPNSAGHAAIAQAVGSVAA